MIPTPRNLRAVRGLEAEIARLTGDTSLARRVRQASAAGRPIDVTLANAIERALVKRGAKPLQARKLLAQLQGSQKQTVMQVTDPATLAQPLIKRGVVGWARDPDKKVAILVQNGTGCRVLDDQGKEIVQRLSALPSPTSTAFDRLAFLAHARRAGFGEDEIPYFYLDRDGNVTIGIGHLVPDEAEANLLANTYTFVDRATGQTLPSSSQPAAVLAAFRAVSAAQSLKGSKATAFKPFTHIDLPESEYIRLFMADVNMFLRQMRKRPELSAFSTYPKPAQLGIMDMAFTLGVAGLVGVYKKFTAATRFHDWADAELESRDRKVATKRQDQMRAWLTQAARREPFFLSSPISRHRRPRTVPLTGLLSKQR